jgi:protein-disulfide isomerase
VNGHEAKAAVERDVAEGLRAGVDNTPTFFVNGRRLTGTQPYEAFRTVIEEERTRPRSAAPPEIRNR